ncbi:TIGR04222 domain-containing membrane protein [Streptomyces sp. SAJ15]|uniref:TIGR04222 domain-containing membrane protein n=1 Tax=Streptomyces sp. SAJ15 TaxID=2011095 RepID=UPI001185DD0C|nr:TIGR04222 domain-containing membrane protein [Streptomyces sp. SAJ15]TVL92836.1 TIGR04222 domain-containing membrane protein [Streptomyces sp. SAJ15]
MLWVLFLLVAWVAAGVSCARLCSAAVAAADAPDTTQAVMDRDLNLYETAFLSGGPQRVTDLALVSMYRQHRVLLAYTGWVTVVDPDGRDELERSVITAIGPEGQSPVPMVRAALATTESVRALADRLVTAGLAVPLTARAGVTAAVRQVRGACALVTLAAAAALLMVPPETGRGMVVAWFALPLVLTVGCLLIAQAEVHPYTNWASPAGQRMLGRITVPRRPPRADDGTARAGDDLTALAVHGAGALADPALRAALRGKPVGAHWGH